MFTGFTIWTMISSKILEASKGLKAKDTFQSRIHFVYSEKKRFLHLSPKWRKFQCNIQLKCRKWTLNKGIFDSAIKEGMWPTLCSSYCNSWKTVSPHPLNRRQKGSTNKNKYGKGENLCRWQELVLRHQALKWVT
jgi:hypothetical protein